MCVKVTLKKFEESEYCLKELKILIAGLANAGKTSILRVLDDKLEKIPLLKPTQGVEQNKYKVLGLNIIAWDLGGQVPYRQKYLNEYKTYFSDAVVLYYVIDVQDESLFKESVKYLKDILDSFAKMEMQDVYVVMLLHKYDTHIQIPSMVAKVSALKETITKLLLKIPSLFFETSIYDPYTIFQAMSDGILHQMSGRDVLHQKLKELAAEFNAQATIMITNKGYVYGAWHSKDVQITELGVFFRSMFGAVRLFLEEEKESKQLAVSEQSTGVLIALKYKDQVVVCGLMVPKSADISNYKVTLAKKQKELSQMLNFLSV